MEEKKKRSLTGSAWREAKYLIWSARRRMLIGLFCVFFSRLLSMVLPASTKYLIDEVIGKKRTELLPWIALAAGSATLVQGVTSFFLSQLLGVEAQRAINDLRRKIHAHAARLPIRYFDSTKTGVLVSRIMTDPDGIRNLIGTGFVQMAGGLMTASLALVILVYLNWRLTLIAVGSLAAYGIGVSFAFSYLRPQFRERGKINADLTGRLSEFLGGIRVVKAYTAEKREEIVFAGHAHRLFRTIAKNMTWVSMIVAISATTLGWLGLTLLMVGAKEALAERMTVGDIFMFTFLTALVVTPLVQMSAIGTQITDAFAGLDRIRELMGETPENEGDEKRAPLGEIKGNIEFQNVRFEYDPGVEVLKWVSFQAPAGSTTALVGSSGSGKSTLISLVMAFNHPKSGKILIDGTDLAGVRLHDYRSNLGVVLQENFLFDGTIAENIGYGRPRAPREEIIRAAKIAHCDEFTERFEKKYDTVIGERGVKVSGGQRQRIAIARAILADPKILILDEATSSLDSESE
ncbi:ABC transporter ATP-binding protein, partial [Candidatus Sumerlaeota bacterium]|nr:ABC transporter ATP-binding protein [Candidatus Sumerlaeota bacterium]